MERLAGWSGIAAVALFGGGSAIWGLDMPSGGTPTADVVDFYADTADRIVVGASLSLVGIAAFLLFAAAVRQLLIDAGGDDALATTAFGGALLGMAAGVGAETINMVGALRARDGELSDALAQSVFEISQVLGSTASGLGVGIFAVASAAAALRGGIVLPRWLAIDTLIVGLVLLTPLSGAVNVLAGIVIVVMAAAFAVVLLRGSGERRRLQVES